MNTAAIGKTFAPTAYAVGREKVREYASAVGETNPLYFDVDAAREAGYADVVAPPMFAVVYSSRSLLPALFDPEVGMDFARMVHGGRESTGIRWSLPGTRSPRRRRSRTSPSAAGWASTYSRPSRSTNAASPCAPASGR